MKHKKKASKGKRILSLFLTILLAVGLFQITAPVRQAEAAESESDAPAFAKNLHDNGDGTYTLSLSVTGESDTSSTEVVNKANVILVLDTSSSMNNDAAAGTTADPHIYYTVNGTPGNPSTGGVTATYYRQDGAAYSQVYYRNGNWYTSQYGGTQFTGPFYSRSRFWAEYHALTDDGGIVDSLLAQNTTLNPDIIEIGIASFGRGGATNLDFSGTSNTNAAAIKNVISGLSTSQGTNWEEGLQQAHNIIGTLTADEKENETTYVVFLTDGQPTTHANSYTVNQNVSNEFNAAKDDARTLVNTDGAEFFGVFTWGDQQYYQCVQSIVGYAYTGTGNYNTGDQGKGSNVFNATSTEALINALKQIADQITNNVGYTDTGVHDGITSMTSSTIKTSTTGDVTGLKYYRSGGSYGEADPANGNYGTEWTNAPHATQGTDGVLNWELGENFDLEDGVTYTVTFVVWPKQDSLDLVADLNNGIISYDSLTDDQKSQIKLVGGKYTLKTNTDYPSVSYKTYTQELDEEGKPKPGTRVESELKTSEIDNPDPVSLAEEKLNALKIWEDSLDPSQREDVGGSVTLYLKVDGKYYFVDEAGKPMGVTLQESENWEKSNYISIAPGIMVTEASPAYDPNATHVTYGGVTYALIEEGHDYVFEESETDKHFELTAYHHHPMIMGKNADGSLHVVDVIFTYDGDTITGIEDIKELSDSLSATNTLKGGINITKKVVDENGAEINDINPFTVTVTMTDADGNALPTKTDGTTEYTIDYRIYYGPNNPNYDAASGGGRSGHIYKTGTSFEETIYVGDVIRVVNVEDDTIYTVTETAPKGYEYVSTTYEISYGGTEANRKADPAHQVQGNSASYAEVTNKYTFGDLEVSKTVEVTSGNEEQAKAKEFEFTFKLYEDNTKAEELTGMKYNYTKTDAAGTETTGTITEGGTFTLKDGEKIHFVKLPEGAYYEVIETAADGYVTTVGEVEGNTATGTIVKNAKQEAAFTNTYSVTPVIVDPPVKKDITGTEELYNGGDFTFVIANTAAPEGVTAPMPTNTSITNSQTYELENKPGYYEFGEIKFTAPGKYTYTVTETGSVIGVTNDAEATKTITFTVTDKGDGTLSVTPETDSAVFNFTNVYKTGKLDITKTVVNTINPNDDTKFTFTLTLTDADGKTVEGSFPYTIGETTGDIASGGTLQLANGETAVITEIPDGVNYTVAETAVDGYTTTQTGDTGKINAAAAAAAAFTNTYGVDPTTVSFPVKKDLVVPEGLNGPAEWSYTVNVAAQNGAPEAETMSGTITNETAEGTITFGDFTFTAPGTYTYTVTETGTVAGVTNDTEATKTVTVNVVDNGDGTMTATADYTADSPLTFTNTYAVNPATVDLEATKVLVGRDWLDGESFTFTVSSTNTTDVTIPTATATVTKANQTASFADISITKPGTYTFTISETSELPDGITKSGDITATVEVTDDGEGNLVAGTPAYTPNAVITNTYEAAGTAVLTADKQLVGRAWKDGETVEFTLYGPDGNEIEKKTIGANGTITFSEIAYTEADAGQTYNYTISETSTLPGGVTKSSYITATVAVTDNGDGTLATAVTYDNNDTIINTYTADPVKAQINIAKTIEGYVAGGDSTFEFTITGPKIDGSLTKSITTSGGTGTVSLDPIEYTFEDMVDDAGNQVTTKDFVYTVKETEGKAAGFTYDTKEYTVTVTVTDDQEGHLTVTDIYKEGNTTQHVNVINEFEEESIDVTIHLNKIIDDQSGSAQDATFNFELLDGTGALVEGTSITTSGLTGSVDFAPITYTASGTYNYILRETAPAEVPDGWTYDTKEYPVVVTVADNFETAQLEASVTIDGTETTSLSVTNVYKAAETNATLQVTKIVEDTSGSAATTTFTFTLTDAEGTTLGTASVVGEGTVSFDPITYTTAGTYSYTIQETAGGSDGWINDNTAYPATVTVTDEGGHLVANVTYTKEEESVTELTVTNIYDPKDAVAAPEARKVVDDQSNSAPNETFTFQLLDGDGNVVETVTRENGGPVAFSELTFAQVGTYNYTIQEVSGNTEGYTYDTTGRDLQIVVTDSQKGSLDAAITYLTDEGEAVITNPYKAKPTDLVLDVTKVVEGTTEAMSKKDFVFTLTGVDEAPMSDPSTVTITGSGNASFGAITYDKAGTYTYTVVENAGDARGYTYDTAVYTVVVTVADEGGQLVAVPAITKDGEEAAEISFTNIYKAASTKITPSAKKVLEGRALAAGEFEFNFELDGEVIETAANDADGKVSFSAITFEEAGKHSFKIYEVTGTLGGVTYDETVYEGTITITDDGEGELIPSMDIDPSTLVFTNTYEPESVTVDLNGKKILTGRDLAEGEFEFQLEVDGKVVETVKNAKDGSITFTSLTYEEVGKHTFKISEIKGSAEGVTYDSTVYEGTITVTDNGKGELVATVEGSGEITFTNTYKQEVPPVNPPAPPTGDPTNLFVWMIVMLAALFGVVGLAVSRKRR